MIKNINELSQWAALYFPKEYLDQELLTTKNEEFLNDFSFLIYKEEQSKNVNRND